MNSFIKFALNLLAMSISVGLVMMLITNYL